MRFAKSVFRLSTLISLRKTFPRIRLNTTTLAATGLSTGLAYWMCSEKIFAEEQITVEIEDNLQEGEMKEVQVGPKIEDTVLVMRYQGKLYCTQSKCAHFGFALSKGLLVGDKLICPLHNAGFDIKTGKQDQGPVFDGLKTFPVEKTSDGKIKVTVPKVGWDSKPERRSLGESNVDKSKKIVIIGAGPTGLAAAETLRDSGYNGLIYMISKEKGIYFLTLELPYDRTLLSKMSDAVKKPGPIRNADFFKNDGIVFVGETTVTGIDYS